MTDDRHRLRINVRFRIGKANEGTGSHRLSRTRFPRPAQEFHRARRLMRVKWLTVLRKLSSNVPRPLRVHATPAESARGARWQDVR